jgi:hypothetical protein
LKIRGVFRELKQVFSLPSGKGEGEAGLFG